MKQMRPWEAAALGIVEQSWTLTIAAAVVVVRYKTGILSVGSAFLLFTALSTATVLAIFVFYARHPDEALARLSDIRDRITKAGPTIFIAATSLAGAFLIINGVLGLVD